MPASRGPASRRVEDDFSTIEAVADAIHDVVGPTFRLERDEQQDLISHAKLGSGSVTVNCVWTGEIPDGITFIRRRDPVTAPWRAARKPALSTQEEGAFGQSALTRQPVLGSVYAPRRGHDGARRARQTDADWCSRTPNCSKNSAHISIEERRNTWRQAIAESGRRRHN